MLSGPAVNGYCQQKRHQPFKMFEEDRMFTPFVRRLIVAAVAGATTIGVAAAPALATTAKPVTRLAGSDRIGTSIAISNQEFPTAHSAKNVILTAAYTFADAMSAGPLGKLLTAPVLLTTPGELSASTLTEIERVLPAPASTMGTTTTTCTAAPADAVYIVGGDAAIAAAIDTQLNTAGFNVVRIFGADRFATSVAVAQCEGSPSTVFLATGNIFADALSAGPAAASKGGSVLLTYGQTMPPSVATYLAGLTTPTVYAVGQAAHVADPTATPIVGGDRFATAALVASEFFTSPSVVGIATGSNFPDALAGGSFMGVMGGPMLLTTPNALQSADGLYIGQNHVTLGQAFLFGGTATLSPLVATQAGLALNQG
jgi:putative cell wall-binding protein